MNFLDRKSGFTLIELLVVVAIIGVLASVVLVSLNSARMKANDALRVSELKQISNALELYYNDNGHYPLGVFDSRYTNGESNWNILANYLLPYISPLPIDPKNGSSEGAMCSNCGEYFYKSGENWDTSNTNRYVLSTYLAIDGPLKKGINEWGPYYTINSTCETPPAPTFWYCSK